MRQAASRGLAVSLIWQSSRVEKILRVDAEDNAEIAQIRLNVEKMVTAPLFTLGNPVLCVAAAGDAVTAPSGRHEASPAVLL
ncbi:MAG: hypothetical protein KDJ38_04220, partial [Gammaproteobacteria bacterium]|nr:hypothetical protein [Gammaproteobacteria bacterium]